MSGSTASRSLGSRTGSAAQVIEAGRVRLVPLGLADAAAIIRGHRPPGARWAEGYPTDRTLVAAGLVVTAEGQEAGALGPYRSYQIVRREDGVVVGDCGFLGPPDGRGEVHLGFGVADVSHGHRYAGEALRELIAWAREQPEVAGIMAEAARTNIAAIRVLQSAGMRAARGAGDLVCFSA